MRGGGGGANKRTLVDYPKFPWNLVCKYNFDWISDDGDTAEEDGEGDTADEEGAADEEGKDEVNLLH